MPEQTLFAAVCAAEYGEGNAILTPLSSSPAAISHSFLVEQPGVALRVLHAYREAWLEVVAPHESLAARVGGLAALLAFFGAHHYPAPRLVPTKDGAPTSRRDEWAILMTEFVAGEPADYALSNLHDLGAAVGRLHRLQPPATALDSWWALDSVVPLTLERLIAGGDAVPAPWREWYDHCRRTLEAVIAQTTLPRTLIHADAWLGNALRAADGQLILIDWECAGLGPAVLDLGSLILHAHYDQPDYQPQPGRLAALLDGYCQHRQPTPEELAFLPQAVQFGPAFRSALFFFRAQQRGWGEWVGRHLIRERARFAPSVRLANAAQAIIRQWD